jgi:hypothetical protein
MVDRDLEELRSEVSKLLRLVRAAQELLSSGGARSAPSTVVEFDQALAALSSRPVDKT